MRLVQQLIVQRLTLRWRSSPGLNLRRLVLKLRGASHSGRLQRRAARRQILWILGGPIRFRSAFVREEILHLGIGRGGGGRAGFGPAAPRAAGWNRVDWRARGRRAADELLRRFALRRWLLVRAFRSTVQISKRIRVRLSRPGRTRSWGG